MRISIIVPAFNEEKLLGETLACIRRAAAALTSDGCEWELIVCDNNSSDHTADIARSASATVVFDPVNQIARARNRGASMAQGDWLMFVDADTHPSYALFAEVLGVMRSGRVIGGGATLELDEAGPVTGLFVAAWNGLSRVTRWAAGSFLFCEVGAFRAIGGFNEALFASEELDLSRRLRMFGNRTGRRMVILNRHPLITSARKLHLYRLGVHLRFFLKAIFRPGRTLKRREECMQWYDGRR